MKHSTVTVLDNPDTIDRYTIIHESSSNTFDVYTMSPELDVNQYSHTVKGQREYTRLVEGEKIISVDDLPDKVQQAIIYRVTNLNDY